MCTYEITYCIDYDDYYVCETHCERETFTGTWTELQDFIKEMKRNGCYHIDAECIAEEDDDDY